jgi:hypothetical protein
LSKTVFGCTFYSDQTYIFEIRIKRRIFDTPFAELEEKSFHLLEAETIDELIDTNHKCRLFFKIDLQEYFAVLICLSADEICQPFSWGVTFM